MGDDNNQRAHMEGSRRLDLVRE